ncbi:MAG: cyclase family protein [Rhodospirillales bacterium]|nr:cyclase family protein [Rhodospirillales bacterium]MDH3912945.1 cyclase family protein [Rhodospirillales bacterium]MDH3920519.1 cyclase family protein [Rhodospirillales bacterium]MDH3969604.1 cyclase family protein [Rhodospirillales bacterium]
MNITKSAAITGVLALGVGLSNAALADCSPENWRDCEGKPWVVGNKMETPIGERWWPHPLWGEGDQAGATNWYKKPEVVQRAIAEADRGKTYSLGRPYDADMPLFGARKFSLRIPGTPTGGPFGGNKVIWHDEFLATEVGQVGTQFDGLGHIGVEINGSADKAEMRYYNGFTEAEIGSGYGLKKIGVEQLHPITARGVLIDVAGAKGVAMLDAGYEITRADVEAALAKQGLAGFAFKEGDGVFFHTGWGKLWKQDNGKFNGGEPGIGMEVAKWLSDEVKAGVVGADSWAVEAVPNPDGACVFCVHQHLLARHGILLQENMYLDDLVGDGVNTFMYVYSPAPITGATGSMGAPVAID